VDRILAITNPAAGSAGDAEAAAAVNVLKQGADVVNATTRDRNDLLETLRLRDGRDIVVMGGDGSLHVALSVLHELDDLKGPILGLIPVGTGNDFARSLELPDDPEAAARVIIDGVPRALDLIVDESGEVVANSVHLGVGVDAGREAARWKPKLGKAGYVVGAISAGLTADGIRVKVTADGEVIADGSTRVLQVAIANGRYIAGGTPIAPDALVDDGRADVVVSFAVSRLPRVVYGLLLRLGRHVADERVRTARATRVTVSGVPFGTNNDGELHDPVSEQTWQVHPGAYQLMVPAGSPTNAPG
jgi:diacylglycerol kinase (ATP)